MKTEKELKKDWALMLKESELGFAKLARSVKTKLNVENYEELFTTFDEIRRYGADSGFTGFISYYDTCKFYKSFRYVIQSLIDSDCDNLGTEPIDLVKNFRCIKGLFSADEIGRALYGRYDEYLTEVYNALAWYALETVAYKFCDYVCEY